MIPLTDKEKEYYEAPKKKNATYVKRSFTITKKKRRSINYIKKLEINVILQENVEVLHIPHVI